VFVVHVYCTSCKGALLHAHAQCCPVTDHAHLRAKALHVVHIAGRVVIYIMAVPSNYTFANEGRDVFLSVDKDVSQILCYSEIVQRTATATAVNISRSAAAGRGVAVQELFQADWKINHCSRQRRRAVTSEEADVPYSRWCT
jgi:hypothetical protein